MLFRSLRQRQNSARILLQNAYGSGIKTDAEALDFAVRAMGESERKLVVKVFADHFALRGPV